MKKLAFALLSSVLILSAAHAGEKEIRERIAKVLVNGENAKIAKSEVSGLYEVIVGAQLFFASEDGQFLIPGSIYDLDAGVDISEQRLTAIRKDVFAEFPDNQALVFTPKGETKYTVNVFTDIDCHFCRKFHEDVKALNARGIKVRYFMYPRAGLGSPSAKKLEAVWCADNQQAAMTTAKKMQPVTPKSCTNPVARHYEFGQELGLQGTPMIVTGNGQKLGGYVPATTLEQILMAEVAAAKN